MIRTFCFDTNIFIDSFAKVPKYDYSFYEKLDLESTFIYSCIVDAEVFSYLSRVTDNLIKKRKYNSTINQLTSKYCYLNKEIVDNFIQLDSWYEKNLYKFPHEKKLGKNDMWIASTSFTYNAMLFSNEKSYHHLTKVKFNSKTGLRFFEYTHVPIKEVDPTKTPQK